MKKTICEVCIVLGDDTRYVFLEWIIGRDVVRAYRDVDIRVRYGQTWSADLEGTEWNIRTNRLLPGMELYVPKSGLPADTQSAKGQKYCIFSGFPFDKKDVEDLIFRIRLQRPEASMLLLLMELQRNFASTDYVNPTALLDDTIREFEAKDIPCLVVRDRSVLYGILNWEESASELWMRQARMYLEALEQKISIFRYDYELFLEEMEEQILSEDCQSRVCSLASVQRYPKEYIWDSYTEATVRVFFPQDQLGAVYYIVKTYQSIFSGNPLVIWDLRRDCDLLGQALKCRFVQALEEQRQGPLRPRGEIDRMAYLKVTQHDTEGINILFWNAVQDILKQTLPELIVQCLEKRYEQLKEMLT